MPIYIWSLPERFFVHILQCTSPVSSRWSQPFNLWFVLSLAVPQVLGIPCPLSKRHYRHQEFGLVQSPLQPDRASHALVSWSSSHVLRGAHRSLSLVFYHTENCKPTGLRDPGTKRAISTFVWIWSGSWGFLYEKEISTNSGRLLSNWILGR